MFSQQEWQQRVKEIIEDRTRYSPYYLLLGMRVKELHPGRSLLELEAGPCHLDERGQVHPGVVFSLADAAAGVAAATLLPEGSRRVVTVEIKVNFIAGTSGGTLFAVGRVTAVKEGIIFCRAQVESKDFRLLAESSATLAVKRL